LDEADKLEASYGEAALEAVDARIRKAASRGTRRRLYLLYDELRCRRSARQSRWDPVAEMGTTA
jgi:hypothetical protein